MIDGPHEGDAPTTRALDRHLPPRGKPMISIPF
jgi:hypothetical protein